MTATVAENKPLKNCKPLKICMIEACGEENAGSIGAWYVRHHANEAGFPVDMVRQPSKAYDVELISVHHCTDFERLAKMPKKAKWRIVGGHPMQNNPLPVIPFADAICIGEGESWIKQALPLLTKHNDISALSQLPGTIICKDWIAGKSRLPSPNIENPLPDNPPYLNRPNTLSAAWYVEIARGCPFACTFCELGHSTPYRYYNSEHIKKVLEEADINITRKINFYAPDEAAHPEYHEMFNYLQQRGYSAAFSSMRVDSILKRGLPALKKNALIRVGIDGLTEETRKKVKKPITDRMIIEYFRQFIDRGHIQFKMFFIIGYPWEQTADFDKFERLMKHIFAIPLKKNVRLRIKWTPFIPQPCTPLADTVPQYDYDLIDKINVWHALNARARRQPGWFVENDGLMGRASHKRQCELTAGDESLLCRAEENKPIGGAKCPK